MRTIIVSLFAAASLVACNSQNPTAENVEETVTEQLALNFYGDTITMDGAVDVETFKTKIAGVDSLPVKLEATINETCKMKGCWMTVDLGNGEEMRVRFKDYGFFVPTEGASGKVAVMEGYAFTDTISVDHLKHLAEDAGKTAEEIAAISEPEIGVNFEATGVIIKD